MSSTHLDAHVVVTSKQVLFYSTFLAVAILFAMPHAHHHGMMGHHSRGMEEPGFHHTGPSDINMEQPRMGAGPGGMMHNRHHQPRHGEEIVIIEIDVEEAEEQKAHRNHMGALDHHDNRERFQAKYSPNEKPVKRIHDSKESEEREYSLRCLHRTGVAVIIATLAMAFSGIVAGFRGTKRTALVLYYFSCLSLLVHSMGIMMYVKHVCNVPHGANTQCLPRNIFAFYAMTLFQHVVVMLLAVRQRNACLVAELPDAAVPAVGDDNSCEVVEGSVVQKEIL